MKQIYRLPFAFRQVVAAGALLLISTALFAGKPAPRQRITFLPSGFSVLAEKAASEEERSKGLMYRKSLGDREAMVFYFDESYYQTFWMYHTLIPLTVIFLDDALRIVDMQQMEPCAEKDGTACPVYTSRQPARYAIEVNQDFVGKHRIRIGDRVTLGETR